jgi:hypothetical protein
VDRLIDVLTVLEQYLINYWTPSLYGPLIPDGTPDASLPNIDHNPTDGSVYIVKKLRGYDERQVGPQILIDELPAVKTKKIWVSKGFLKIMHPLLVTIFYRPNAQRLEDDRLPNQEIIFRNIQSEIDRIVDAHRFDMDFCNEVQLTTWEDVSSRGTLGLSDVTPKTALFRGSEPDLMYRAEQVIWFTYYNSTSTIINGSIVPPLNRTTLDFRFTRGFDLFSTNWDNVLNVGYTLNIVAGVIQTIVFNGIPSNNSGFTPSSNIPVTITDSSGYGAVVHAVVNGSGVITSIVVDNGGSGYSGATGVAIYHFSNYTWDNNPRVVLA